MEKRKYKSYKTRIYEENPKEVADKLWDEYLLKITQNLEGFVRRYGKEEGEKKYNIFTNKSKHTKEKYIKNFGKEVGKKKWYDYIEKKKKTSKRSIEYWLKQYDGDYGLAKVAQANYQKRDKFYFIKKYGNKLGIIKYQERCQKQSNSINEHYKVEGNKKKHAVTIKKMILKYGEELGPQRYKEFLLKTSPGIIWANSSTSKVSQEFCKKLELQINNENKKYVKYAQKNDEWWIYDNNKKQYFFYDFAIIKSDNKKIIEFNGDFWHANPKLYKENWKHNVLKVTAKELWDRDEYKCNLAKKNGFDILIVWEKEWRESNAKVINKCIGFLENKIGETSGNN